MKRETAAVILAAGRGTRMRSDLAKVLHPLAGAPLIEWALRAVESLVDRTVVVIGHQRDAVRAAIGDRDVQVAVQEPQEGTGHALACAVPQLDEVGTILVLPGDAPLLRTESLGALLALRQEHDAAAAVLTFRAADPSGYGRIVRAPDGSVEAIVEEGEANDTQRAIDEVNSAVMALDARRVLPLLDELPRGAKGEHYLTDAIGLLRGRGERVVATEVAEAEALGINTPEQLAAAERMLRGRGE